MFSMVNNRKRSCIKIIAVAVSIIFTFENIGYAMLDTVSKTRLRRPMVFRGGSPDEDRVKDELPEIKLGELVQIADGISEIEVEFKTRNRFTKGRAIFLKPGKITIEQTYIPDAVAYDFGRFKVASKDPEVLKGEKEFRRFPGKTLKQALEEYPLIDRVIVASNSLQTNFWGINGFLIINGKYVAKPEGSLGLFQKEYTPLNGKFWVFVFDEDNIGVKEVSLEDGDLDSRGSAIINGLAGLPLVSDGRNVSSLIEKGKPSLKGNQIDWDDPHNQKAAMSAVGKDKDGNIFFIHMVGDPNEREEMTFHEFAEIMIQLGALEAIALGTSADVSQYIKGDEEPYLVAKPRRGSMTALDYPDGRPLAAFIFVYSKQEFLPEEAFSLRESDTREDL